jgi:hypothetical protein
MFRDINIDISIIIYTENSWQKRLNIDRGYGQCGLRERSLS